MAMTRYGTYVGGPLDGGRGRLFVPDTLPWPLSQCRKVPGGGTWEHYEYGSDGVYRYVGQCVGIDHHGPGPDEWQCCCGQPGCHG